MKDNKEILEKAIAKAIDGGWKPLNNGVPTMVTRWSGTHSVEIGVLYPERDEPAMWVRELEGIIFNHEFAEALWGDKSILNKDAVMATDDSKTDTDSVANILRTLHNSNLSQFDTPAWQFHLQRMVIADDPIAYLGEHLDD